MARRSSSGFDLSNLLIPAVIIGVGVVVWKNLDSNCTGSETTGICGVYNRVSMAQAGMIPWGQALGLGDVSLEEYPNLFHSSAIGYAYSNPIGVPLYRGGGELVL